MNELNIPVQMTGLAQIFSEDFFREWQTLIGSALGPFLAIILSAIGFVVKGILNKRSARKESIRRAEVCYAQTLTHIFTTVGQLRGFVSRVNDIIQTVEKISDEKTFALQEANFPPVIDIHFDDELPKMKFRSYYAHNKVLITEYVVRWANSTIQQIRRDYERLLQRNEAFAEKMPPPAQRQGYAENLKGYIAMVDGFLDSLEGNNVDSIAQAKVYNLKLMKRHFLTIWKYERVSFRIFRNKAAKDQYCGSLDAVDRINDLIAAEAHGVVQEARGRAKEEIKTVGNT